MWFLFVWEIHLYVYEFAHILRPIQHLYNELCRHSKLKFSYDNILEWILLSELWIEHYFCMIVASNSNVLAYIFCSVLCAMKQYGGRYCWRRKFYFDFLGGIIVFFLAIRWHIFSRKSGPAEMTLLLEKFLSKKIPDC
jgi:hypothetical protein